MELLNMNRKERKRLTILSQVKQGALSLIVAAGLLGLGYRQTKRVWLRYRTQGAAGLVHRSRGRPSTQALAPTLRARVLRRYAERYPDFGPTLAAEYLAAEGLGVDHETLRRWLVAAGVRTVRRRGSRHRQWRERRPCFGALVQLDGSEHDWFEGRRGKCVLMVMVDDATNRVWAQFFEAETTRASYEMLAGWVRQWGLPLGLYVDRDSIYRCEGLGSVAEQLAGQGPQTQFGRAMAALGVTLILAHSPQAKGRVERMNGVLQDRLVKALRLAGIRDLGAANEFLARTFLPAFNRQFNVVAANPTDVHGAVPRDLDEVLSWEEARVVQRDWTVAHGGRRYQVERAHAGLSLVRRKVIVRTLRDGRVQLVHRGVKLRWRALPARPVREVRPVVVAKAERAQAERAAGVERPRPGPEHPWRRASGRRAGRAEGQPPLRSGRPSARPARRGKPRAGR